MATEIERETIDKLSEAVSALSVNVARLSERLDAQRETLTEAIRASQEETRRMVAEQNANHASELYAAIERVHERIDRVEVRIGERIDHVEVRMGERIDGVEVRMGERIDGVEARLGGRIDHVDERIERIDERMDEKFASISTKIHWALGVAVTVGIGVAGILVRLFFG
ncbi:MAG: hypothetical protein F4X83_10725 [Chloroflexi bacterium]|nr:hypothetical protein [Chloroflexota bacterium]